MRSYLLLLCFIVLCCSCQNEDAIPVLNENSEKCINFVYNEVAYSSSYVINEHQEVVLLDEIANDIYQNLRYLPELFTVLGDTMKFYNNEEEFLRTVNYMEMNDVQTRSSDCRWSITAYTTVQYKGKTESHSNSGTSTYTCNKVSYDNNWGAMICYKSASPINYTCLMTFYEDGNCQGRSFLVQFLPNEIIEQTVRVADLRAIPRASWGRDWDNKISSFNVRWVVS